MPSLPYPVSRRLPLDPFNVKITKTQLALLLFGLLAAFYLCWPVWRALMPLEINRNEAWNAWHVSAALEGRPLYPNRDDLVINNYPPLSFYIVGLVSKLTSDVIFAGRLISLLSVGGIALSIALCIRALGGSRGAAALGGFWFLATMGHFFHRYVGMNDPQLLALAVMGMALALFLRRLSAGASLEPAIACMVLAGFIKHNIVAIPLTAMLWLCLARRRLPLREAAFGAGLAALGLALCYAAYGPNFIEQLLMPRNMSIAHVFKLTVHFQWIAPALLVWGVWAWSSHHEAPARFSALLVAISFATGLLQMSGDGVSVNAFFELVFASGIAIALAFEGNASKATAKRFGAVQIQTIVISILVLRLILSDKVEPYLVLFSPSHREEVEKKIITMNAEIERVRALPEPISCSVMTVCYRAGKSFVYDDFAAPERVAAKRWSNDQLQQAIANAGIRFETIDKGVEWSKKRIF